MPYLLYFLITPEAILWIGTYDKECKEILQNFLGKMGHFDKKLGQFDGKLIHFDGKMGDLGDFLL